MHKPEKLPTTKIVTENIKSKTKIVFYDYVIDYISIITPVFGILMSIIKTLSPV